MPNLPTLPEQFPLKASDQIWRQLRNLVAAIEARFQASEREVATFDEEIAKFEAMGLEAVNDTLTPLVQEAVGQLSSLSDIFTAVSHSTVPIGLGDKTFIVVVGEQITFIPLAWVAIRATGEEPGTAEMTARVVGYDNGTGQLDVDVADAIGSGSYSEWTITASPAPPLDAPTNAEMVAADAVVAGDAAQNLSDAIDALKDALESTGTFRLNTILTDAITANKNNYAPTGYDTNTFWRLTGDAAWSITGIDGGEHGRVLILVNIGGQNITLKNEDGASEAVNRFALNDHIVMMPGMCTVVAYDGGSNRWRALQVITSATSGGVWTVASTPPANPLNGEGWFDLDTGTGYLWVDDGTSQQWVNVSGMGAGPPPLVHGLIPGGRLTCITGNPVDDGSSNAARTTIYYAPYIHGLCPVWDGTKWVAADISGQIALALDSNAGHTYYQPANYNYDLYLYLENGTLRLVASQAWDTNSSRGTLPTPSRALNGILLNSAAQNVRWGNGANDYGSMPQYRGIYLGSFRATAAGSTQFYLGNEATSGGTPGIAGLVNAYNRVRFPMWLADNDSSYTYNVATWRARRGGTNFRHYFITGLPLVEEAIASVYDAIILPGNGGARMGVTLNRTNNVDIIGVYATNYAGTGANLQSSVALVQAYSTLPIGWNYIQGIEWGNASQIPVFNQSGYGTLMFDTMR